MYKPYVTQLTRVSNAIPSCSWRGVWSTCATLDFRSRDGRVLCDSPGLGAHAELWRHA